MHYFKDKNQKVFAFEASQLRFVPKHLTAISKQEADQLIAQAQESAA
jgi:hypothetical protein